MNKEILRKNYEKACNDYLKAFCEKHEFDYDSCEWLAGDIGGCVEVADMFIGLNDIIIDINKDVDEPKFIEYYDYSLRLGMLDCEVPTYISWLSGYRPKSEGELIKLEKLQVKIKDLTDEFKNLLKN